MMDVPKRARFYSTFTFTLKRNLSSFSKVSKGWNCICQTEVNYFACMSVENKLVLQPSSFE